MGFIFGIFRFVFKLIILIVVLGIVAIGIFVLNRENVVKPQFQDGGHFEIKLPNDWCAVDNVVGGALTMYLAGKDNPSTKSIKIALKGKCGIFTVTPPEGGSDGGINFMALDLPIRAACYGLEKQSMNLGYSGGDVIGCAMKSEEVPSGTAYVLAYPVGDKKSLQVVVDYELFQNDTDSISEILKSVEYKDK